MEKKTTTAQNQEKKFTLEDFRALTIETFETQIRKKAIEYVGLIMQDEVAILCGKAFQHKKGELAYRAGSEMGSIALNGQRTEIRRPRVRRDDAEIPLNTYTKLHCMENITEIVFKMMINGVSTRSYDAVLQKFENDLGVSKSAVSRQFIKKSREYLNEFNARKFPGKIFWAIMIDGIAVGGDVIVVVLGVDTEGNKHFLGISQGSTENSVIVAECLHRLDERDIQFADRVVAVLDGSKALRKAVVERFGDRVEIHRCLIHKMRNIEAKLAKKYHAEFKEKIKRAYWLNDYNDAKAEMTLALDWLRKISSNAAESLEEGFEDLLTLHRIKMPPELRTSFYTTNLIESGFSNPRFKMNRVKKWIKSGDMIQRWAGAALFYQEKKFRKVKRYDMIDKFLKLFIKNKENKIDKETAA
jgi:putative transposase